MIRTSLFVLPLLLIACGGGGPAGNQVAGPAPVSAAGATPETIDSIWRQAEQAGDFARADEIEVALSPDGERLDFRVLTSTTQA